MMMSDIDIKETESAAEAVIKAKQLPDPSGYKILCMVPKIEATFGESDIIKPDSVIDNEQISTVVLFVAKLGPQAYADKERYPNGPWCKVGDFILARAYSGTRLKIHGTEWRIINDDTVEAVVEDPRGINRA
jgi:co-chaperonin GroES (HSP10)